MPRPRPRTAAIIVGAGRGTRFGADDKVMTLLNGRPVLSYSLDAAQSAELVDAIVIVTGNHLLDAVTSLVASRMWSKVVSMVVGGERRQDSVAAGLAALPPETALVAIHDAARPLVSPRLFDHTLMTAHDTGAAIAAIPVSDTLKRVVDNQIVETVPREGLWAAQTPQSFDLATLRRAFSAADTDGLNVTDEASLFERLGIAVAIVPGSPANLKITHPADLAIASSLLKNREKLDP